MNDDQQFSCWESNRDLGLRLPLAPGQRTLILLPETLPHSHPQDPPPWQEGEEKRGMCPKKHHSHPLPEELMIRKRDFSTYIPFVLKAVIFGRPP